MVSRLESPATFLALPHQEWVWGVTITLGEDIDRAAGVRKKKKILETEQSRWWMRGVVTGSESMKQHKQRIEGWYWGRKWDRNVKYWESNNMMYCFFFLAWLSLALNSNLLNKIVFIKLIFVPDWWFVITGFLEVQSVQEQFFFFF